MHATAMLNCASFFGCYAKYFNGHTRIVEIGSQDVNGSLRAVAPPDFEYVGVDFVAGKGVDVVLDDPYTMPFETGSADIVVSSSCFEHAEMFWVVYLEIMRILKPRGLFYLNVPANGEFHRYPVDCWRFYPDSGNALVAWARRNDINAALLESYICFQLGPIWNDFVAVFLKDASHRNEFGDRILHSFTDFNNGLIDGRGEFLNFNPRSEDQRKLGVIAQVIQNQVRIK